MSNSTQSFEQPDPRVKMYTGWASYKNVKSGNYNRQPCWECAGYHGYPDTPGVFNLNLTYPAPVAEAPSPHFERVDCKPPSRCNANGSILTGYYNYLNTEHAVLAPRNYVKGYWPDEQLIYTNVPQPGAPEPPCKHLRTKCVCPCLRERC